MGDPEIYKNDYVVGMKQDKTSLLKRIYIHQVGNIITMMVQNMLENTICMETFKQ